MEKPSIVEVIGADTALRRVGKEVVGLCSLHQEKTPSLFVNEEKGVFLCRGCGAGGSVFDYVMLRNKVSYKQARRILGLDDSKRARSKVTPAQRRAANLAQSWALEQRAKLNCMIAIALEHRDLADEAGDSELAESFDREWFLLTEFYDSLEYSSGIVQLLAVRQGLESITEGAGVCLE